MRPLVVRDDLQLRRLENAIARFGTYPPQARERMACLLAALEHEKAALLRAGIRRAAREAAAPSIN